MQIGDLEFFLLDHRVPIFVNLRLFLVKKIKKIHFLCFPFLCFPYSFQAKVFYRSKTDTDI